ncbi:MAG: ImcF-related family protein [Planctomycetota bacterium]
MRHRTLILLAATTLPLVLAVVGDVANAQDGPGDPPAVGRLGEVHSAGVRVRRWLDAGMPDNRDQREEAREYLRNMSRLVAEPVTTALEPLLGARTAPQNVEEYAQLCARLRAYRTITLQIEPDRRVIERALHDRLRDVVTGGAEPNDDQADTIDFHLGLVAQLMADCRDLTRSVRFGGLPSQPAIYRAERNLSADTWAASACRAAMDSLAAKSTPLTVATLLDGAPGAELLTGEQSIPGVLSQSGYDAQLLPAFRTLGSDILTRLEAAGVRTRSPIDPLDVCRTMVVNEVRDRWDQLIRGIRLVPAGRSVEDALALLERLADQRDSPLRTLLWVIWDRRELLLDNDSRPSLISAGNPGRWIPAVLRAIGIAHAQICDLLHDSPPGGQRVRTWLSDGRLTAFGIALNRLRIALVRACDAADPAVQGSFREMLRGVPDVVATALKREANTEIDLMWRSDVLEHSAQLATRYPFKPDSADDASWDDVQAMWRPGSGRVARTVLLANDILTQLGMPMSNQFQAARNSLERMQTLLFTTDTPRIEPTAEFADLPEGKLVVTVGKLVIDIGSLITDFTAVRRALLPWKPGTDREMSIVLTRGAETWSLRATGPWALLRVFDQATSLERHGATRTTYTFSLIGSAEGSTPVPLEITVMHGPGAPGNPLLPAAFSGVVLPARLTSPSDD